MNRVLVILAFLAAGILAVGQPLRAQITVSTSGQYSSGDYIFAEDTQVFGWTNSLTVRSGRIRLGVSVPFVVQSDPWITYTGAGMTPSGGPRYSRLVRDRRGQHGGRRVPIALPDSISGPTTGLGDPQFSAAIDLISRTPADMGAEVTVAVKPPIADADGGFSTGSWDGGVGLRLSRSFMPWFILAEGTYWWLGDLDDVPLNDGIAYSVAVGQTLFDGRWGVLGSLNGSTTVIDGVDAPLSINGGLSYMPGQWAVNATAGSGLTEGAANWSFGIGASFTFRN